MDRHYHARDRTVLKNGRDGLGKENLNTREAIRVSRKEEEVQFGKHDEPLVVDNGSCYGDGTEKDPARQPKARMRMGWVPGKQNGVEDITANNRSSSGESYGDFPREYPEGKTVEVQEERFSDNARISKSDNRNGNVVPSKDGTGEANTGKGLSSVDGSTLVDVVSENERSALTSEKELPFSHKASLPISEKNRSLLSRNAGNRKRMRYQIKSFHLHTEKKPSIFNHPSERFLRDFGKRNDDSGMDSKGLPKIPIRNGEEPNEPLAGNHEFYGKEKNKRIRIRRKLYGGTPKESNFKRKSTGFAQYLKDSSERHGADVQRRDKAYGVIEGARDKSFGLEDPAILGKNKPHSEGLNRGKENDGSDPTEQGIKAKTGLKQSQWKEALQNARNHREEKARFHSDSEEPRRERAGNAESRFSSKKRRKPRSAPGIDKDNPRGKQQRILYSPVSEGIRANLPYNRKDEEKSDADDISGQIVYGGLTATQAAFSNGESPSRRKGQIKFLKRGAATSENQGSHFRRETVEKSRGEANDAGLHKTEPIQRLKFDDPEKRILPHHFFPEQNRSLFTEGEMPHAVHTKRLGSSLKHGEVQAILRDKRERRRRFQKKFYQRAYYLPNREKILPVWTKIPKVGAQHPRETALSGIKEAVKELVPGRRSIGAILAIAVLGLITVISMFSGCVALVGGGASIMATTYPGSDEDITDVDAAYQELEEGLDNQVNSMEATHPDYDEYRYQVDEITHNPFQLASLLTTMFGNYTLDDVKDELPVILNLQYTLNVTEEVEVRTRTVTDPETGDETEEEYDYYILNIELTNHGLDYAAGQILTDDKKPLYDAYLSTHGNRDGLFEEAAITADPSGGASGGIAYEIPPEALSDERFKNMIGEAEKYLNYPYVWGGSNPSTSFDCSGFVAWVINNCGNGWSIGRPTAEGIRQICDPVRKEDAMPGDLIFFQGTYDTPGASHIGIYVGDGMMIHCGKPVQYTNINTPYWQQHFFMFGRMA